MLVDCTISLVVKAVHIEVVSILTSAALLAAFRRFVACRGLCRVMHSNNGTHFTGTEAELGRLFSEASNFSQEVARSTWIGNSYPLVPHIFMVRVIVGSKLTFEEFSTVTTVIEACLNSRPISPISDCEEDVAAVTQGNFLIGSALTVPAEPFDVTNEKVTVCSKWKMLILMRNHFWKR